MGPETSPLNRPQRGLPARSPRIQNPPDSEHVDHHAKTHDEAQPEPFRESALLCIDTLSVVIHDLIITFREKVTSLDEEMLDR